MKKIFTLVILLSIGITQIYAQCFQCDSITKAFSIGASSATGTNSFAGGYESGTTTNATNSFVFGTNSLVNQSGGIAIGSFAKSYAINSLVFGQYVTSSGANSITIGTATSSSQLVNNKNNSIMFGVTDKPALTIVKKTGLITPIDLSLIGIGTDDPEEMVHVVGKLLIDRTETTASSLQFRYTEAGFGGNNGKPYYWDIFTDDEGLRFNTITNSVTNQAMVITGNGSVGIGRGVTTPQAKLHVDQNILANGNITTLDKFVLAPAANSFSGYWELSRTSAGLNFAYKDNALRDVLFMSNRGFIGIGTTNPTVMLDVNGEIKATSATIPTIIGNTQINGTICAEEIYVQLTPCWPDYVFSKDYKLLPLVDVEQFIKENKHLPNIPSSAEVEANGVELGAMNAILLQKVEELTLYIIQMEKRVAELEQKKGGE